jgi:hypothetical protein
MKLRNFFISFHNNFFCSRHFVLNNSGLQFESWNAVYCSVLTCIKTKELRDFLRFAVLFEQNLQFPLWLYYIKM